MVNIDYAEIFADSRGSEDDLIPILQKTQEKLGYLSEDAVQKISQHLKISENQIFGVASFYSQFRFTAPGRNSVRVCMGTACHVQGGHILCEAVERELGVQAGETTDDKRYDFDRVACLGCCALAPVVQVNNNIHSRITVIKLQEILKNYD